MSFLCLFPWFYSSPLSLSSFLVPEPNTIQSNPTQLNPMTNSTLFFLSFCSLNVFLMTFSVVLFFSTFFNCSLTFIYTFVPWFPSFALALCLSVSPVGASPFLVLSFQHHHFSIFFSIFFWCHHQKIFRKKGNIMCSFQEKEEVTYTCFLSYFLVILIHFFSLFTIMFSELSPAT